MSAPRSKVWYLLHDSTGEVAAREVRLDCGAIEINGLQRVLYEETKEKLQRIGIDTSNYRPPPPLHPSEQRCRNHVRPGDDVEAILNAAKERPLDRLYREHLAARCANAANHGIQA
jgi:hypothetical protein